MSLDTTHDQRVAWRGHQLVGNDGQKIGKIEEIYLDTTSGQPEWALVNTGLFGTKNHFVPLQGASASGDDVTVPYDKEHVKNAPSIDADGQLSHEEERALYAHYSLDYTGTSGSGTGMDTRTRDRDVDVAGDRTVGHDTSGPNTDDAMTRSEQELNVGTREVETGRVRLRKWVETENVTKTVPVKKEQVRVEREPITDANVGEALDGPELSEEEHEVVLHEEQPVVEKKTVPVERVRLDKDTVVDEHQVSEEVARERIEVEGDADDTGRGRL